mmetsp:Transcript_14878/g.42878  ORF Transcript_14878/g.42878 Transcript_14878/m.42878 type:complete len:675 (+) Transcript_14878:1-2025(+)
MKAAMSYTVIPPCWESAAIEPAGAGQLSLEHLRAWSKDQLRWHSASSDGGFSFLDDAAAFKDGVHVFHHPGSPCRVHPSKWCVTLRDLDTFENEVRALWKAGGIPDDPAFPNAFHNDPKIGPTIYMVNKYYIQPETRKQGGMSWALMKHPKGLKCDVFATHAWSEGVFEFTSKVRGSWPPGAKHLWACFLALPQNADLNVVLQGDIHHSPFAKALKHATHMLVIPNKRQSIYTRLWCVYEAFLALQLVSKKNLVINLPSGVPSWQVKLCLAPGFLLWFAGALLSYFTLAERYGDLFPPLLWLLMAVTSSLVVVATCKFLIRTARRMLGHSAHVGERQEIVVGWVALFVVGVGVGFVQHGLRNHSTTSKWQWEPGEGWACGFLTFSVVLMHASGIVNVITAAVRRAEGLELEFKTVRNATCSQRADEERILHAIRGKEDNIDMAIRALRVIGRFSQATHQNVQNGLSPHRLRDGLSTFSVTTACCAWSYWWVTDLSAANHHIWATWTSVCSCALAVTIQYTVGEKIIFAMDAFLYFGLLYIVTSLIFARFLWGNLPLSQKNMSFDCLGLQAACFVMMCLMDLWFYRGGYARVCASWGAQVVNSCEVDEECDDDAALYSPGLSSPTDMSPEVWAAPMGHEMTTTSHASTDSETSDTEDGDDDDDDSVQDTRTSYTA